MSENSGPKSDDDANREQEMEAVIADYIRACETGLAPDRREILERHPELADELRQFFGQRDRMNQMAEPIRGFGDALAQGVGPGQQLSYVGNYELLEEIARGGMGVVYKARQTTLGRIVAVKMIVSGRLATEQDVQRFQVEAQAAAGLQHPNIVSIHEVGQHEGWHYFSMDYVEGRDLSAILRENLLPAKQAATYVRQMAEAIHYAHLQGTLHRDLKPSNILIDSHDQVRITDFGLAMRVEGDSDLTRTGQIVGTPSYMPPEQAQAKRSLIGPGSDVYALGAVLYECLTGRPPFRAESVVETIQQVIHVEAASPRLLNPGIARDLETICLKCLEKEPHRRYGTARQLGEDLGRFLRDEPILARPISRPARLARWCRRNPLVGTLTSAAVTLLLVVAGGATVAYLREANLHVRAQRLSGEIQRAYGDVTQLRSTEQELRTEIGSAEQQLQQAQQRTTSLEADFGDLETQRRSLAAVLETRQQKLYSTLLYLAQADWDAGEVVRADGYLDDCPSHLRDRRWERLKHLCRPSMRTFDGTSCLAIRPNGQWLATVRERVPEPNQPAPEASKPSPARWEIVVWDFQTEQLVQAIPSWTAVQALVIHPDNRTLISAGNDTLVQLWDVVSGELRHSLAEHTAPVTCLSLSADGQRLASASFRQLPDNRSEGEIVLWDLNSLTAIRTLPGKTAVAIDPSGQRVAFQMNGQGKYVVRIEPFITGENARANTFEIAGESVSFFSPQVSAFSPQGLHIAITRQGIEIWNVAEKQRLFQFRTYGTTHLAFSRDGTRLAYAVHGDSSIRDRTPDSIVVRNLHSGERERILPWYESPISAVAFSPDGLSLVTTDQQNVKVWDITPTADPTEEILVDVRQMNVGPYDWPQWGGSRSRVNTPPGKNIPSTWDPGKIDRETGDWLKGGSQNIKWVAPLGSQTYGNPVVANGKIFVGTNNGHGYLKHYSPNVDLGVLLCFKEETGEFLWQHSNEKLPTGFIHDWPLQGVCSTPAVDGDRLWYVTNRGEVMCLDTEGFADGEDDGPVQGQRQTLFDLTANLALLAEPGARTPTAVDALTIRLLVEPMKLPVPAYLDLRKRKDTLAWDVVTYDYIKRTYATIFRVGIEQGELRVWRATDEAVQELLGSRPVDLTIGLNEGQVSMDVRRLLAAKGFDLPVEGHVETTVPSRSWRVLAELTGEQKTPRELSIQLVGTRLVCDVPMAKLEHVADVVWSLNMMRELGVFPHNMSNCSPLIVGDWLFVCTSNGVDESHKHIPAPDAPSFIALDRWTGKLLWTDKSPGANIQHAQWASPSYGVFAGQPQVIFAGGDGWVYSFDPRGDGRGNSKLLWKFDANFKESKSIIGGRGTRNEIIAFPAIYDGLVYIVMGQDPEHGEGSGCLWCLDPAKHLDGSDVSESLAVNRDGRPIPYKPIQAVDPAIGERSIPNPQSAVVWRYTAQDRNGDGVIDFEEEFHRSLSTPVIKDDILYVADFSGLFHCLNAKTGKAYWTYDLLAACWNSALLVDGKVFIGDEDGDMAIFRHSADPAKSMKTEGAEQKPWYGEIAMPNSIYMTPIVANNVLYIATKNMLYAIESSTGSDTSSP